MSDKLSAVALDDLSGADLEAKLREAKEELFNLRFQAATGQLENNSRLRTVKKDIARIYTVVPPLAMPERFGWCCLRYLTLRGISMITPRLLRWPRHGGRGVRRHDARGATTSEPPARERVPCW